MPPMEREKHEEILNKLLDKDLEQSERTELLQTLRQDYSTVLADFEDNTKRMEKLEKDNNDLVVSNSQLFRQLGTTQDSELDEQEQQKSFSEEVTISQLEDNAGIY